MATFKAGGKDWVLSLDAPTIRRIRDQFDGLNLIGIDGKASEAMADDPALLVDVLFVLCQEQADRYGVDDVAFAGMLVGDTIDHATEALLRAIEDFSPSQRRKLLRALAEKNAAIREAGVAKALEKINDSALQEQALAALEQQMDEELRKALTRLSSATSSPVSSESAPAA